MAVRMKDIARDLDLSVVTISKVLRNHSDISAATRKRVLQRMKEVNYQPNLAARALITGRTKIVGLVVPDLLHPFFAQIAMAVSTKLRAHGYSLMISSSEEDPELELQEIDQLLARPVEALLIASAQRTPAAFRKIQKRGTPYILIDRRFEHLAANFVGVDDELVGMLATSHLIDQGCRRIAHIRGPEVSTALGRIAGYQRALAEHHLTGLLEHIVTIGASGDGQGDTRGYQATMQLLTGETPPDGIFCYNDPVALGTLRALLDAGLRVPEDVAVVGCGNVLYSDFLRVPLTTVDQKSQRIGERVAELALSLIGEQKRIRPRMELIEPRLVVRASSLRRTPSSAAEKA